jgi:signal peptidase I
VSGGLPPEPGVAAEAAEAGEAQPEPSSRRRSAALWEQVVTLAVAVLIALGIRSFVIEPFRIPSGSMLPTLLIGDHLFVNKFVYGVRIPFTELRLPGLRAPQRGDVVVFTVANGTSTHPADRRPDLPREEFVKRIIGLPGDHIEFRDERVFVNGEPIETVDRGETFVDDRGETLAVREVHLESRDFRILEDPRAHFPGPESFVVEPGRYFMMGDNRDHSLDSRMWGTVRLEEIEGPAFLIYWSWHFNGTWLDLLEPSTWWNAHVRWSRIGAAP